MQSRSANHRISRPVRQTDAVGQRCKGGTFWGMARMAVELPIVFWRELSGVGVVFTGVQEGF